MGNVDTRLLGTPVNKTAALVTSPGFSFRADIKRTVPVWDAPPITIRPANGEMDLKGKTFGRLRVIGKLPANVCGKNKWLCQCSCGLYEPRRPKAINNPRNHVDACYDCRTIHERKRNAIRNAFFEKHGCWPDESSGVEAKRLQKEWDR